MIGLGTVINASLVILGGLLGILFGRKIKNSFREIMTVACGLSTVFIGASGALSRMFTLSADGTISAGSSMLLIVSLVVGGLAGEAIDIEQKTERFGAWLRLKSHSEQDKQFIEGFMDASLTICIGAMAIIGPMSDALYHDYSILITKGILDCIIVMAMSASLGKGAVFSVIPLFLWQEAMTLLAAFIGPLLPEGSLAAISLVGNTLIFCVGLNLMVGTLHIRVANLLPSLIIAALWGAF